MQLVASLAKNEPENINVQQERDFKQGPISPRRRGCRGKISAGLFENVDVHWYSLTRLRAAKTFEIGPE